MTDLRDDIEQAYAALDLPLDAGIDAFAAALIEKRASVVSERAACATCLGSGVELAAYRAGRVEPPCPVCGGAGLGPPRLRVVLPPVIP